MTIVCGRVRDTPAAMTEKSSTIRKCQRCRNDIWVSMSSVDLIGENPTNTTLVCMNCITREEWESEDFRYVPVKAR